MLLQHAAVVHFVDVVAGEYQNALGLFRSNGVDVLVDGVGRTHVPVLADALHRRENLDEFAERVGHDVPTLTNMPVQRQSLVLSENVDAPQIGIDAIRKGNVDDAVDSAKSHRRFSTVASERIQTLACTAGQQNSKSVFHLCSYPVVSRQQRRRLQPSVAFSR